MIFLVKEQHHGLPILYHVFKYHYTTKRMIYSWRYWYLHVSNSHTSKSRVVLGGLWLILEDDFEVGWVEIGIAFWNRYNGFSDYFGWGNDNFVDLYFNILYCNLITYLSPMAGRLRPTRLLCCSPKALSPSKDSVFTGYPFSSTEVSIL